MDLYRATDALAALAQPSRLSAFRLLVQAGPKGLPAGDIAAALDIPHNTLSTHLSILTRAGLFASQRDGRRVIYRLDIDGVRQLLSYLLEDCCRGAPEVCTPALNSVLRACCPN